MSVEGCSNRNLMEDEDEDDEAPLVFKRSSTPSKLNQSNSEARKSTSQRPGGQSGRSPANGERPSIPKSKPGPSSQLSIRSDLNSLQASSISSRGALEKYPGSSPKLTSPIAAKVEHLNQGKSKSIVKEEKSSGNPAVEAQNNSEDSEDDKPLSARFKDKRNSASEVPDVSRSIQKPGEPKHEESDDEEAPLSSKFRMGIGGTSTSKSNDSDDKKPLAEQKRQNCFALPINSAATPNKRSSVDVRPSSQSSIKKPKLSNVSSSSIKKPKPSNVSSPTNSKQTSVKDESEAEDDDDHVPISQRLKQPVLSTNKLSSGKKISKPTSSSVKKVEVNVKSKKIIKKSKYSKSSNVPPSSGEGQKWTTLVHNGVIFPPPYKPHGVKMLYKGKPVDLTPEQEEVATMFAVMLDTDYMNKPRFRENFFNDWKKILGKNHVIQNLEDCDFKPIYEWHQKEKEKKKQMSTEEKKALREEKLKQEEKYMWAVVDGVKEKVGNFRVEPPGLFRGRGEHPKMGKLKKRIRPSDITINIGKDAPIPECLIPGESWRQIKHDNTVTWLAYWNDPINPKEFKYVFLAASSSLKGQSDKEKYEKARILKDFVENIRATYTKQFTSKDPTKQQIAVATYLIDQLALRAGNEKDDDEADTVGCCTLKVENVEPIPPNILKFDFLGKDSIRYLNEVPVEPAVFKAIQQFRSRKKGSDDLFDRLDTSKLNAHLKELMPGLTAKVFRTYNASVTLDQMLSKETKDGDVAEKVVVYQQANKQVAIICNHQRTVSKSHTAQMMRLNEKIEELKGVLEELQTDLSRAKKGKPPLKSVDGKQKRNLNPEALERKIVQTNAKIEKMERDKETKEDLKTVALGTSKINYLDPRITVAWCKRHEVPIEKIFNKSLLAKFSWAMDVDPSFRF